MKVTRDCSVDGCDRPAVARGWCDTHYARWQRHGDASVRLYGFSARSGEDNPWWKGDDVSYSAIHRRLQVQRGSADAYTCACGAPARQWAYDHADPDEKIRPDRRSKTGLKFSTDLSHYVPMCAPCHKRFDLAWVSDGL